jgi:hypothetical protein
VEFEYISRAVEGFRRKAIVVPVSDKDRLASLLKRFLKRPGNVSVRPKLIAVDHWTAGDHTIKPLVMMGMS